jgi:hypothetical protein
VNEPSIWGDIVLLFVALVRKLGRQQCDLFRGPDPPAELPSHWAPHLRRRWSKMNEQERRDWLRRANTISTCSTWVAPLLFAGVTVSFLFEQIAILVFFGLAIAVLTLYEV